MRRIGLTGGIASGKSTVAEMLRKRDFPVLDADALARAMLEPGQAAYDEVVRGFGRGILVGEGAAGGDVAAAAVDAAGDMGAAVDRKKLAAIVFSDPQQLARLNDILHPRIREEAQVWFKALERLGGPELAFEDAALIFEAGLKGEFDKVIVCWCRPEQQLARLKDRGMAADDAQQRIAAQMPMEEKRRLADEVIDCSGTLEETELQVAHAIEKLKS
jgi:dephospho-CoA kinase